MKATKTFKIRFLALLFSFALIAAHLIALPASAVEETMPVRAYAVYAVHGGELLAAKNAGELIPPASTAKIMSGLLFCEAFLDKGDDSLNNEKLQRKITVTSEMLRGASGRKLGLAAGDVLTLEALLYAAIGGGFNDAAYVLACTVSGSAEAFTDKMNSRAAALGATSTHFANPTGLDDDSAVTTVNDLIRIALAASEFRAFMKISSFYTYKLSFGDGSSVTLENRNKLHFPNADSNRWYSKNALGMNVGMTDAGGNCAVTLVDYGGAEFICIVMGEPEEDSAYEKLTELAAWAGNNYELATLRRAGERLTSLPVSLSDTYTDVDIVLGEDVTLTVPRGASLDDTYTYELRLDTDSLKASFEKGRTVGRLEVIKDGRVVASAPAVTAIGVEANGFLAMMDAMREFFTSPLFFIILGVIALGAAVFFLATHRRGHRRSRRSSYRRRYY